MFYNSSGILNLNIGECIRTGVMPNQHRVTLRIITSDYRLGMDFY